MRGEGKRWRPHLLFRGNSNAGRIANATTTFYSDNQAFIAEIGKSLAFFKAIAVDMEKDNQFEKVKELEEAVLELLSTWDDCMHFSMALESIGNSYQPKDELTNFKKLLEDDVVKIKRDSPFVPQKNPFFRQFKEAIWNVHHAGRPMPGEEQEDLVMTSTQCNLLNIKCPLSGKPVTNLKIQYAGTVVLSKTLLEKGYYVFREVNQHSPFVRFWDS
ncbi:hypothetical protein AAC387_Pa03g1823 [Persea americana]